MRDRTAWRQYRIALVIADTSQLGLAVFLAQFVQARLEAPLATSTVTVALTPDAVLMVLCLLLALWLRGSYDRKYLLGGPDEYALVISACVYGTIVFAGASYLLGPAPLPSRGWLLLAGGLAIPLVGAGRFMLRRVAYALRAQGTFVRRVLIAGASEQGLAIASRVHGPLECGVDVVGFLDDYAPVGTRLVARPHGSAGARDHFPVVGHPATASELAAELRCDLIIVVPTALSWESQQMLVQLGAAARDTLDVRLAPAAFELSAVGVEPAPLGYMPLLRLVRSRIVGVEAMIRFGVDVLLASVLFATLAPAVVLVLAGGWVRGVRPLIDRRNVVGRHGTVVSLPLLSSRLTDNMLVHGAPALLLVIRGQLALAGPKPTPVEEQDRAHQWRGLLQSVRPGLTGPWRLMRTPSTPAERTLADIWWVHNWTIWQHLFVLIQTGRRMIWRASQDVTPLERWTYLDGAAEAPLQPPRVEVAA